MSAPLVSHRTAVALLCLVVGAPAGARAQGGVGTVAFQNSASPAAQAPFLRGVALLHSFEYAGAARAFREAQQANPAFALAYWGEAMTYNHPVWDQQDRDSARAALARLGPTPAARLARTPTPREREYLEAVETLYGEGSKADRDTAYMRVMERVARDNPDDIEARLFYALSLLGLSRGVRDVPTYMRAGAIALELLAAHPNHPGAAHYVIHAFDDPVHAPIGLAAARAYSRIAPEAAHAQHMTTHIFLAMGMWDQVVSQNVIATDLTAWVPGHYTSWLGYGYLQLGRQRDARQLLERVRGNLRPGAPAPQINALAAMRAAYVVNTERWDDEVARWSLDSVFGGRARPPVDVFVRGLAALKRGDRPAAEREAGELASRTAEAARELRPGAAASVVAPVIMEKELRALLRLADGAADDAVALLREATALEDAMPAEFGPPDVVKPSHELLGETLLGLGRSREAADEFTRALRLAPGRALALRGLARATAALTPNP